MVFGFFQFEKNNKEYYVSHNDIVDQYIVLLFSKMFCYINEDNHSDTRKLNSFIVGIENTMEYSKTEYNDILSRALKKDTTEYLGSLKPSTHQTNLIASIRIIKLQGESNIGEHVGTWKEIGLVFTGTNGENNILFNRSTGFEIEKTSSDIIRFKYNIVF